MTRLLAYILFALFPFFGIAQEKSLSQVEQEIHSISSRLNANKSMASTLTVPRVEFSINGGSATAYSYADKLFLIEEELLGENGKINRSFFFEEGQLAAVIDKTTQYSQPVSESTGATSTSITQKYLFYKQRLKYQVDGNNQLQTDTTKQIRENGKQLVKYVTDLRNELFPTTIPNVQLKNKSGEVINSNDLLKNGKAKVFVFWSRYCKPCKLEMKGMTNVGKEWFEDYDAEIILVSLANYDSRPYEADLVNFLSSWENEEGIYFLHDDNRKLFNTVGSQAFPSTVLFDKDGNLYRQWDYYDDGLERSVGLYFKKLLETEL